MTVTVHKKVIQKTRHNSATAVSRLMNLDHVLVEG